jgi:RNA polymerase sigma factor (sigma-70 family)
MNPQGDILHNSKVLSIKASQGDEKSFREIYNQLSGKMYALCLRYTGNKEDANDVFQDAFLKLYRNLSNYRGDGSFEGWSRRIFVTTCIDFLNKKKMNFSEVNDNLSAEAVDMSGFEKLAAEDILKLVQQLPTGYRTVFNLYLIEGYSHKEISEIFSITESSSKSQLSKAKLYLKKLLANGEYQ